MSKVLILTKPDCSKCESLKMFLKFALNNKYQNDIELVNQVEDKERFNELAKKFDILGLPAMIFGEEVLREPQPSATTNFLEKHIGKK